MSRKRREALALTQLADMLAFMRLRTESARCVVATRAEREFVITVSRGTRSFAL